MQEKINILEYCDYCVSLKIHILSSYRVEHMSWPLVQHTITHCNTPQHIATHRNTPQQTRGRKTSVSPLSRTSMSATEPHILAVTTTLKPMPASTNWMGSGSYRQHCLYILTVLSVPCWNGVVNDVDKDWIYKWCGRMCPLLLVSWPPKMREIALWPCTNLSIPDF